MPQIFLSFIIFCFSISGVNASKPLPKKLQSLAALSNAKSPSGFENNVKVLLASQWSGLLSQIHTDGMGNLIGRRTNAQKKPHILVMAHMDEVGFMVKDITDDGFIHMQVLGGIPDNVIAAQRWAIASEKGEVTAYSGVEAIHIMPRNEKEPLIRKDKIFLDIGAESKQQVLDEFKIRPGQAISPISSFTKLSHYRYLAKALDDRIGLATITESLKRLQGQPIPNTLSVAATVQEEIGLRGASVIYNSLKPDIVINLEIGIASDFPELARVHDPHIKLGKGPTLFVYDRSMIPNQGLVDWIQKLANKKNIPIQYELEAGYGEDGAKLQQSGPGIPAINIGIPVRYAHQHGGVFDIRDYDNAIQLVTAIIKHFNKENLTRIKGSVVPLRTGAF